MDVINHFGKFPFEFVLGEFYFFQVLNRDKSGGGNKTRCIKTYYIDTEEYLHKKTPEMIALAHATHSRVYMHPARRDKRKISLQFLRYVAENIEYDLHDRMWRGYETVVGRNKGVENMWIIDVDTKDEKEIENVVTSIEKIQPFRKPYIQLETVHGWHLIYKGGFDRSQYKLKRDIHTNNPTVIYAAFDESESKENTAISS